MILDIFANQDIRNTCRSDATCVFVRGIEVKPELQTRLIVKKRVRAKSKGGKNILEENNNGAQLAFPCRSRPKYSSVSYMYKHFWNAISK